MADEETWTADRRLWHTADKSKVVEEGDPEAAFLYAAEGDEVPKAEAQQLGALKKPARAKAK